MSKLGSNNETDSLEEFFSDRLKNESMQPSEQVWERIEGSLRQDKKRRRGFIWLFFGGLFFIGAGISTYVFMHNKNELVSPKTTTVTADKKTNEKIAETKTTSTKNNTDVNAETIIASAEKGNVVKENTATESITNETIKKENTAKEEKTKIVRIQLGAFKKQIDKSIFDKTGLVIKQETNESGVTRYYAEVSENEKQEALQKVQQAGFADAFVKNNTLLAGKNEEMKSVESANQPAQTKSNLVAAKNNEEKKTVRNTAPTSTKLNVVAAPTKNAGTVSSQAKNTNADLPLANNVIALKNEAAKNETVKTNSDETKQSPSNEVAATNINAASTTKKEDVKTVDETKLAPSNEVAATNTVSETNKVPEETKTEPEVVKQNEIVAKTDTTVVATVTKTDSVKTEDKKKDEPVVAKAKTDSTPTLTERWALLLTGGPNFFLRNTNNSLVNTLGEKQPTTYNTSLKVEYKLLKRISVSAGINYSYFTAQQDATLFSFNKNQTTDFLFYSSYGPMAVNMNTMLQGYSMAAPVTYFHANYSYTSKINTLQVPIEAKWYFVNGKRINLYTALGASGMFVISEQTNLSVIKETMTNNVSYNQVNTTKFNALLMFGLGGDVRLFKKLYFTVDGGFRYSATNLSNTTGITTNPTYFSVNGGLKIKL
jgi:hypothetical protein